MQQTAEDTMVYGLLPADYEMVRPLFQPIAEYLTFCAAVLEGIQPGRVFVDDLTYPCTALMITRDVWGYLAGDPHNDAFNRALNKALFTREIVSEDAFGLLLHCHPDAWREGLATVCQPQQPTEFRRRRYICRASTFNWRANIPERFTVQWIDGALLDRSEQVIPDDVRNLIAARGPNGDPLQKGFGFVALHDGRIAAHAVVDCIVRGVGDIGLFTAEDFRQRGLATVTSGAAVEYGLARGLSLITWDCDNTNIGSLRTAEKLGFDRERDHMMYFVNFD